MTLEEKLGAVGLQSTERAGPAQMTDTCPSSSSHGHGSSAANCPEHIGSSAANCPEMATAALRPRVTGAALLLGRGARARTMVLQGCISGEARVGEGQPRYPCAVRRYDPPPPTRRGRRARGARHGFRQDCVSVEAREAEGQPCSPWVVHPPVTMPGEGPRTRKDQCTCSPPHARWNASTVV